MAEGSFKGRTVLVFGAAGALGNGIAEAFDAEGASVVGVDRVEPAGERRLSGVRYLAADVTDDADLEASCSTASWLVRRRGRSSTRSGDSPRTGR